MSKYSIKQALVTSPIPSHPQNHGNRARVYTICKALQKRGYRIHFVYGTLEGLTPQQETQMRATWEHVYIVAPKKHRRKKSRRHHHLIDDWYIDDVTNITKRIMDFWNIDICIANYVWFSKWLETVRADMPRYIDTHDIFSNRDKMLKDQGIQATWFSTTKRQEAKALKRASGIIAIQDQEAATFQSMSKTPIHVIGHMAKKNFLTTKKAVHKPQGKTGLHIGYMASDNPINQHALVVLSDFLKSNPSMLKDHSFKLAGAICHSAAATDVPFEKLGFVENPADFFGDMDLIINPNIGGTGLKIKSVDALAYGKPLASTADGMTGIPSHHQAHAAPSISALLKIVQQLAETPNALDELTVASREAFLTYISQQHNTMNSLFGEEVKAKD